MKLLKKNELKNISRNPLPVRFKESSQLCPLCRALEFRLYRLYATLLCNRKVRSCSKCSELHQRSLYTKAKLGLSLESFASEYVLRWAYPISHHTSPLDINNFYPTMEK